MRRLARLALPLALSLFAGCSMEETATPLERISGTVNAADASDPTPESISLEKIGEFDGGGEAAAEITAFDAVSQRLFVVNGALGTVDVLDMKSPASPKHIATIDVSALGGSANSVDADHGIVAVAIQAAVKTDPGTVAFYRATTLDLISSVTVGALPDMVTFTHDGRTLLVANEAEPNDPYTIDPEGSVSIIDVHNVNAPTVRTAGFAGYNGQADQLRAAGVRIYGPNATVAQDFEPEYIAVSDDDRSAYVTLQENNALAIIDIASASVIEVVPFGYKDHSLPGNALDVSDRDGPSNGPAINIRNWPVFGMYQPDAIAAYTVNGRTYLVTANEGDSRDWAGLREEARVSTLALNPAIFTSAVCGGSCSSNSRLGRLTVTNQLGRNPGTGQFDALYALGGRSFSIWTAAGEQVWDSGDQLEQLTTSLPMVNFNASSSGNALDDRSDNKGPEPEGVALGQLGAKTFAFIGLERVGGVMVYDVTNPAAPFFVTYANARSGSTGDLGPEGVIFVPARKSPSKRPLLIVGNEISGTTAIFQINLH